MIYYNFQHQEYTRNDAGFLYICFSHTNVRQLGARKTKGLENRYMRIMEGMKELLIK